MSEAREITVERHEPALALDLRRTPVDEVLERVEAGLQTPLERASLRRKRRTVGARSGRGTWIRVEARPLSKIAAQGQPPDGLEATQLLAGVALPQWYRAVSWTDPGAGLSWRADEIELVTAAPVRAGGPVSDRLELSDAWWAEMNRSLGHLAEARTTRVATPDTEPISQELVDATISGAFGPGLDTGVGAQRWVAAHADLGWANVTHPQCVLLDWEDWGLAPRGLDSAVLWVASLDVDGLAERVRRERRADLESRAGQVMTLFACAKVLANYSAPARRVGLTRAVAEPLMAALRS